MDAHPPRCLPPLGLVLCSVAVTVAVASIADPLDTCIEDVGIRATAPRDLKCVDACAHAERSAAVWHRQVLQTQIASREQTSFGIADVDFPQLLRAALMESSTDDFCNAAVGRT